MRGWRGAVHLYLRREPWYAPPQLGPSWLRLELGIVVTLSSDGRPNRWPESIAAICKERMRTAFHWHVDTFLKCDHTVLVVCWHFDIVKSACGVCDDCHIWWLATNSGCFCFSCSLHEPKPHFHCLCISLFGISDLGQC